MRVGNLQLGRGRSRPDDSGQGQPILCKYKVIQSIKSTTASSTICMKASYITPASSSLGASRRVKSVQVQVRGDHKHRFSGIKVFSFFSGLFGGNKDTTKSEGKNNSVLQWARTAKMGCEIAPAMAPEGLQLCTVAGGCFWGLELALQRVPGVIKTSVGYTGGQDPSPTYESVCSGRTGHAEAVQVTYDPKEVGYEKILNAFLDKTDPTTLNRQGNDRGTQYRSAIYYHDDEQKAAAEAVLARVNEQLAAGTFRLRGGRDKPAGNKVVVEVSPAGDYYVAESYHQQYLEKGGRNNRPQSAAKNCDDPIRCYG